MAESLIPDFKGYYDVAFTDGSLTRLNLIGATFRGDGSVLYLHDLLGRVYNFATIIYIEKKEFSNG